MSSRASSPGSKSGFINREDKNKKHFDKLKDSHYDSGFFTFNDEKVIEGIQTFTHAYRLLLMNVYPSFTADQGMANLVTNMIDEGHVSGHMKDEVAAELAALIDYCENLWTLFGQLRNEVVANKLVEDPTFSDVTPTTGAAHSFLKPETINTFLETLEERNLVVPIFLVSLLKMFSGVRCELMKPYALYGTEVPGVHLVFGVRDGDLEDLQGIRDTMFGVKGLAIQHMNKFGMSYSKFSTSMITDATEITYKSPEWYIYLQLFGILLYGNDDATYEFSIDGVVNWAGTAPASQNDFWCFLKDGIVTKELKYCLLFGDYHATNNKYGGFFTFQLNASTMDSNIMQYAINGASGTIVDILNSAEDRFLPMLWPHFGSDDLLGADKLDLTFSGAAFAADIPYGAYTAKCQPCEPFNLFRTTKTVVQTTIESFMMKGMIQLAKFK